MIGNQVISEKSVSLSEVKKILEDRKESEKKKEPTYEQKTTLEYVEEFGRVGPRKLKDALEKLEALGLDEMGAVSVIDLKPQTKEELKLVFEKSRHGFKDDHAKKILDVVASLD